MGWLNDTYNVKTSLKTTNFTGFLHLFLFGEIRNIRITFLPLSKDVEVSFVRKYNQEFVNVLFLRKFKQQPQGSY